MSRPITVTPRDLEAAIRNVPDFPQPGIQFKDITPLLADPRLFAGCIDLIVAGLQPGDIQVVAGIDARGFLFASAAALRSSATQKGLLAPCHWVGSVGWRAEGMQYSVVQTGGWRMQIAKLRSRHPASALRGFMLSLCEQSSQYPRGLTANSAIHLTGIFGKGLRSTSR